MFAARRMKVVGVCCAVVVGFLSSFLQVRAQEGSGEPVGDGSDPNAAGSHADCYASGSCFESHDGPGCSDPFCCVEVCSNHGPVGAFCCDQMWDQVCVELAEEHCTKSCPSGEVTFVDPPDGVVDARRPHKPNQPDSLEGMQSFEIVGPPSAKRNCWSFCHVPSFFDVAIDVEEDSPGHYRVKLDRPLPPGTAGAISYRDEYGDVSIGWFIAHPANANGDGIAGPVDILALVDHINGVHDLPWKLYSGDLDHSGHIGPADIVTLIDLLNGSGFAAWYGTALPSADGCP